MPSKIRPDDWDRLFSPRTPKRGGPLRTLANVLITIGMLVVIGVGSVYALRLRNERNVLVAAQAATTAALDQAYYAESTATAVVRVAERTATAIARTQPTPEAGIGAGTVTNGGNLRTEPRIADETIVGLIWPGDQVAFLEQRDVGGQPWYRVRLVKAADNRGGTGVAAGTTGWASGTLLSPPQ